MFFQLIRKANPEDFGAILDYAAEFWLHTQFDEPFDTDHTRHMVQFTYDQGLLAVVEIDGSIVGFCAGVKSLSLGSPMAMVGTEVAWWIAPEHRSGRNGIALLRFMEQLAKDEGIKYWSMIAMESSMPEKVCSMYGREGYHKSETGYTKVLKWQQ